MMQPMLNGACTRPIDWSVLYQLLQLGKYEQAADFLAEAQWVSEAASNPLAADAAASIRQICLACCQCRAEVEWHQQASQTAEQREQQLRNHAQVMLDRVSPDWFRGQASSPFNKITARPTSVVPLPSIESNRHMGLGQRIQNLFMWGKRAFRLVTQGSALLYTEIPVLPILPVMHEPGQNGAKVTFVSAEQSALADTCMVDAIQEAEVVWRALEQDAADSDVDRQDGVAPAPVETVGVQGPPALTIYCLGPFRLYQDDQPVEEWSSSKGQAIFKYLIMHRARPIAKEVLMELFWPEAAPDAARNNLNVAIYGLRRALRSGRADFSHVVFQNDCYLLNPELRLWVDVEEFSQHYTAGQRLEQSGEQAQAVHEYRAAEALYLGEFLAEDRYEDWPLTQRQQVQDDYLRLLDRLSQYYLDKQNYDLCAMMCDKLLAVDPCREETQRRLMRCYSRQGHLHLALRQYHLCVETLARELDVGPSTPTEELYAKIRRRKPI